MAANKGNKGKVETYKQPEKGSGKPKYQNVIKEARVDTKAPRKEEIKGAVKNMTGRNVSDTEASRRAGKSPNIAKQIDREEKVRTGQRTESPTTPKVPVKPKGTQKGHAVTDGDNHTRPIRGRGGSMGAVGRIGGDFLDQTK